MFYSPQQKRKILLDNFSSPSQQVELNELEKISKSYQVPFATFHSLEAGCGDIIHLLIIKKNNYLEKCLFSAPQSCLITISAANILCSNLEKKNFSFAQQVIKNCENMLEKKEHSLEKCPDFQIFSDIFNFPHRIECVRLVIRGINSSLNS